MYEEYYGFTAKPFNIAPDPAGLFLSRKHRNAISSLDFALADDAGLILFTGDIGTGKTTLIHHLLRKIDADVTAAVVFNTNVDADQLLGIILEEFGLNTDSDSKAVTFKVLSRFLTDQRSRKKRPLLIIDEAQSLSLAALEEVRLLSNLQSGATMLLQIMLVGQPELKHKLQSPAMASLSQRIAVTYHLKPFEREETGAYIAHRLTTAGGPSDLFTDPAIDKIHHMTRGIPRSINLLCHAALVYAFADDLEVIDAPVVEEVLEDTQQSGLVSGRWDSAAEAGAGAGLEGQDPAPLSEPAAFRLHESLVRLEERVVAVEARLDAQRRELHEGFDGLLQKERARSDKLLMACAQLKSKYDALKRELGRNDRHLASEPENGDPAEPPPEARKGNPVSDPATGTDGGDL